MNLREKLRIHEIQNVINDSILGPIIQQEWKPYVPVSDIRPYAIGDQYDANVNLIENDPTDLTVPQVFVPGGLLGEFMICLCSLIDLGLLKGNSGGNEKLTNNDIQNLMSAFFIDLNFPNNSVQLHLKSNPDLQEVQEDD